MRKRVNSSDTPVYLDSPKGILSVSGTRYRTTEKLLREFAGPVLEHEALGDLIKQAEVWARSPVTIVVWALPVLLHLLPALAAACLAAMLFFLWRVFSPAAPSRFGITILRVLQIPALQGVYYVAALTLLGWSGQPLAVVVGLAGFIALRFGLLDLLLNPLLLPLFTRMYPLPLPDQVLRAVIVRAALRHNVVLPEISHLESSAKDAWSIRGGRRDH